MLPVPGRIFSHEIRTGPGKGTLSRRHHLLIFVTNTNHRKDKDTDGGITGSFPKRADLFFGVLYCPSSTSHSTTAVCAGSHNVPALYLEFCRRGTGLFLTTTDIVDVEKPRPSTGFALRRTSLSFPSSLRISNPIFGLPPSSISLFSFCFG